MVTPIGVAPDEIGHIDMVYLLADGADYPEYDQRRIGVATTTISLTHTSPLKADASGWVLGPRTLEASKRPGVWDSYAERGGSKAGAGTLKNQMPQHPPLYYATVASVLRVGRHLPGGGHASMHTEVHLLRLLNALILSTMPVIAWTAARRIGASDPAALTAALLTLSVPQLTHIGSAINNDNLITVGVGLLTVALISVVRGDFRKRTGALIGVLTAAAFLTKAFAIVLPVWIFGCYILAIRRERDRMSEGVVSLAVAGVLVVALSAWWWVRNIVRHGTPAPSLHAENPYAFGTPDGFTPQPFGFIRTFSGRMAERFWGSFSGFRYPLPTWLVVMVSALAATAIVAAFVRRRPREGRPPPARSPRDPASKVRRSDLAAIGSIAVLLSIFVFLRAWGLYAETGRHPFIQGRYLFGAVIALAVIVSVGMERLIGRWSPLAALGVVVVMQGTGLYIGITSLWGDSGASPAESWRTFDAWNPGPIPLVPATAGAMLVLVLICALLLAKETALSANAAAPEYPPDQGHDRAT